MEQSGEVKYDGEIIVVADSEFSPDNRFWSVIADLKSGESIAMDSMLPFQAMSKKLYLDKIVSKGDVSKIDKIEKSYKKLSSLLEDEVGADLLKIIMEGRIKIGYLIDSSGGDTSVLDKYLYSNESIEDRGGHSQAYVTGTAGSAAFDLMSETDRTFVLDKSALQWHHSCDLDTGKVCSKNSVITEKLELMELVQKGKKKSAQKLRDRVVLALKNSLVDEDLEVNFTGKELVDAGSLERSFKKVADMQKFFDAQFVMSKSKLVGDFWNLSEEVVGKLNSVSDWHEQATGFEQKRRSAAMRLFKK